MANPKSDHSTNQLSVRSPFARARASRLAKLTGMTITQIVEDALRAYQPATSVHRRGSLIEKGGLLILPRGEVSVTSAQLEAELDDVRSGAR